MPFQEGPLNYASRGEGAKLVDFSSELEGCDAANVLDPLLSNIWLSEEGLPQWLCISLEGAREDNRDLVIRTIGWHCWHPYTTNPKEVTVHVSSDGAKFKIWDTFVAQQVKGTQLFCCAPISANIYPFVAVEVVQTFGGAQTYMNRIYMYAEEIPSSPMLLATSTSTSATGLGGLLLSPSHGQGQGGGSEGLSSYYYNSTRSPASSQYPPHHHHHQHQHRDPRDPRDRSLEEGGPALVFSSTPNRDRGRDGDGGRGRTGESADTERVASELERALGFASASAVRASLGDAGVNDASFLSDDFDPPSSSSTAAAAAAAVAAVAGAQLAPIESRLAKLEQAFVDQGQGQGQEQGKETGRGPPPPTAPPPAALRLSQSQPLPLPQQQPSTVTTAVATSGAAPGEEAPGQQGQTEQARIAHLERVVSSLLAALPPPAPTAAASADSASAAGVIGSSSGAGRDRPNRGRRRGEEEDEEEDEDEVGGKEDEEGAGRVGRGGSSRDRSRRRGQDRGSDEGRVLAGIEGLVANVLDRVQQRQALTKAQAEQEEEQDLRRQQQQEEEQHGQERWGPRLEKIHAAASRVKGGLGSSQSVDGTLRGSLSSLPPALNIPALRSEYLGDAAPLSLASIAPPAPAPVSVPAPALTAADLSALHLGDDPELRALCDQLQEAVLRRALLEAQLRSLGPYGLGPGQRLGPASVSAAPGAVAGQWQRQRQLAPDDDWPGASDSATARTLSPPQTSLSSSIPGQNRGQARGRGEGKGRAQAVLRSPSPPTPKLLRAPASYTASLPSFAQATASAARRKVAPVPTTRTARTASRPTKGKGGKR